MKITLDSNDVADIVYKYFSDTHYDYNCMVEVPDEASASVTLTYQDEDVEPEIPQYGSPLPPASTNPPVVQEEAPMSVSEPVRPLPVLTDEGKIVPHPKLNSIEQVVVEQETRKSDINPVAKRNLFGTKPSTNPVTVEETRVSSTSGVTSTQPFADVDGDDDTQADDPSEDTLEEQDQGSDPELEQGEEAVAVIQEQAKPDVPPSSPPAVKPKSIFSFSNKPKS